MPMATALPKSFSISEFFKFGWNTFQAHWKYLLKVIIAMVVVTMIPQAIVGFITEEISGLLGGLLSIGVTVIQIFVGMAAVVIVLGLIRGKETELNIDLLKKQQPLFWKYLWTSLRVSLQVFLGFLLLIIPGIIWAIKYQFATILTIDQKLPAGDAMKRSAEMTDGKLWQLFLFWLMGMVIVIIGMLALGIGLVVAIPVVYLAYFGLYEYLNKDSAGNSSK